MKGILAMVAVTASLLGGPVLAEDDAEPGAGGWYMAVGAGIQALEGWQNGSQGVLTVGRKLNYRHPDTPRSSVALEFSLSRSVDPITRHRNNVRREIDLTTAGLGLALNTYVTERFFHRARVGLVYRYLERDSGSHHNQARIGFGLGLGLAVTTRLELVADAGLQYLGESDMLYTGALSARYHF
ncbi:MAG: hypothetical protein WED00_16790 [Aquisalimonadaceae bacterium]